MPSAEMKTSDQRQALVGCFRNQTSTPLKEHGWRLRHEPWFLTFTEQAQPALLVRQQMVQLASQPDRVQVLV
jgi:hypothetical protein